MNRGKAKSGVKSYLQENLIRANTYKTKEFSKLDTLNQPDTTNKLISLYTITHNYLISNGKPPKVKISVKFYLDSNFTVTKTDSTNIDGE